MRHRLLRDLHAAAQSFTSPTGAVWNVVIPPDRADLVIHHDAAPWNLVLGNDRWVLIDWDDAGPGPRLWDLAYAAHSIVPLSPQTSVEDAGRLLVALGEGYGLDDQGRADLVDLLVPRTLTMYEFLERGSAERRQPWAGLWEAGHGDAWNVKPTPNDAEAARRLDRARAPQTLASRRQPLLGVTRLRGRLVAAARGSGHGGVQVCADPRSCGHLGEPLALYRCTPYGPLSRHGS